LSPTVSFILPVRDLHQTLRDRVHLILDVLAELTPTFDLVLVDYGSSDDTCELALDLVREFPQVDFLDKGDGADYFAAVEAGIHRSRGEIIFVHDASQPLGLTALHNLWQLRDDADLVMAQSRSVDDPGSAIVTLTRGRSVPIAGTGALQMIRRCAIRPADGLNQRRSSVETVTRTDLLDEPLEGRRLPKLLSRLRQASSR
jgi:hypothetical protein